MIAFVDARKVIRKRHAGKLVGVCNNFLQWLLYIVATLGCPRFKNLWNYIHL